MPTYGQLFTSQQADQNFGAVTTSVPVSVDLFESFLNQVKSYIMFRVVNDNIIVLDDNRNIIYNPADADVTPEEVFTVYSVDLINDLLSSGSAENVLVEQRSAVLSLSFDDHTLETGSICPPYCPNE